MKNFISIVLIILIVLLFILMFVNKFTNVTNSGQTIESFSDEKCSGDNTQEEEECPNCKNTTCTCSNGIPPPPPPPKVIIVDNDADDNDDIDNNNDMDDNDEDNKTCPSPCPEMPDMSKYILKSSIPPCPKLPDMSKYVLKSSIPKCEPCDKRKMPPCPPCPRPRCPKIKCEKIIYKSDENKKCYTQKQIDEMINNVKDNAYERREIKQPPPPNPMNPDAPPPPPPQVNPVVSEECANCTGEGCEKCQENINYNQVNGEPFAYNSIGSVFDNGF